MTVSNQGDEKELTPGKAADDAKPGGAAAVTESVITAQRDIGCKNTLTGP